MQSISIDHYLSEARRAERIRDYQLQRNLLLLAYNKSKGRSDVCECLASFYYAAGDLNNALRYAEEGVNKGSTSHRVYFYLGNLHRFKENYTDAIFYLKKSLEVSKNNHECSLNLAIAYHKSGETGAAEALLMSLKRDNPQSKDANFALALIYIDAKKYSPAIDLLKQAKQIGANDFETSFQLGRVLTLAERYSEAIQALDEAYKIDPNSYKLHVLLLHIFIDTGNQKSAALTVKKIRDTWGVKDLPTGHVLPAKMTTCEWDQEYFDLREKTLEALNGGNDHSFAFLNLMALFDRPDILRAYPEFLMKSIEVESVYQSTEEYKRVAPCARAAVHSEVIDGRRIKVLYISGDIRIHAMGYLIEGLFKNHDRNKFEISLFSTSMTKDSQTKVLKADVENFYDVSGLTDIEFLRLINEITPDLIVDLMGHTGGAAQNKLALLKHLSPPKITYLGCPGTTGTEFIDFIIADEWVLPRTEEHNFSETPLRVKGCYQINHYSRSKIKKTKKSDIGLPKDAVVLVSFNSHYKYNPETIGSWVEILKKTPKTVLWLGSGAGDENLKQYFLDCDIARERIIFSPNLKKEDHLDRLTAADLALDTWPYNAHVTGADYLACGVPMVTLLGRSFAARVGASLLNGVGLKSLVCTTRDAYIMKSVELANNPEKLSSLKQYLWDLGNDCDLFNSKAKVLELERLYREALN